MRNISFLKKITICFTTGLLIADVLLLLGTDVPFINQNPLMIFIPAAIFFAAGLIYPFIWHYRSGKQTGNSLQTYQRFQNIICHALAFAISIFGWKKIFGLQFRVPLSIADEPMSSQSGEWLTWFYFGHSYFFGCIVAGLQIGGSLLLLFRRTRLAGVMLLLPVMMNILLINIFYQMNAGALFQSVALTMGLLFLLFEHYKKLIQFFFARDENAQPGFSERKFMATVPAVIIMLVAFIFIYFKSAGINSDLTLRGSYDVKDLNNHQAAIASLTSKDSVLTHIYFDLGNVLVLQYGSIDRRIITPYQFNESTRQLKAIFILQNNKQDSINVSVIREDEHRLLLSGIISNSFVKMELEKVR